MRAFFSHGPWTKFAGHRPANPSRGISPDTVWRIAAGRSRRHHPRLQTAGCALSIAVVGLRAPAVGVSDRQPVVRTACAVAQQGRAAEESRGPAARRCAHTRRRVPLMLEFLALKDQHSESGPATLHQQQPPLRLITQPATPHRHRSVRCEPPRRSAPRCLTPWPHPGTTTSD